MPARVSEALVLRTYPLQESDLVVSFFTREQGKMRGVAKRARRPKSKFGAGLERLSHVSMSYSQHEMRELCNLDSCELIHSQFGLASDYAASVALDYIAEVGDQLLPAAEPNERFFRLLLAVLAHLRTATEAAIWQSVTYFSLWAVRLSGFLPDMTVCHGCGAVLDEGLGPDDTNSMPRAYFTRADAGLLCAGCRRTGSWELTRESRLLAAEMFCNPVEQLASRPWDRKTASDLRKYLVQRIQDAIERKLITATALEACEQDGEWTSTNKSFSS